MPSMKGIFVCEETVHTRDSECVQPCPGTDSQAVQDCFPCVQSGQSLSIFIL